MLNSTSLEVPSLRNTSSRSPSSIGKCRDHLRATENQKSKYFDFHEFRSVHRVGLYSCSLEATHNRGPSAFTFGHSPAAHKTPEAALTSRAPQLRWDQRRRD